MSRMAGSLCQGRLRLTGRHPFNCEPPLQRLKEGGFLTPPTLHYVRNHGAVPVTYKTPDERQKVWSDWRIKIHGLVDAPLEISMDEVKAKQISLENKAKEN